MVSAWVYYQADGSRGTAAARTHQQARGAAAPGSLFVYGGDVYPRGADADFAAFDGVYAGALPWLAETAGNHDWYTDGAAGYERYWLARRPPASRTPIDDAEVGPTRHHFTQPLGHGWLGVFLDCGPDARTMLTAPALARVEGWLTGHGSRRVVVFLHHARLSRGRHRNNTDLDPLWRACFDAGGPRVAAWVAGHNHNVGIYSPRSAGSGPGADPPPSPRGTADGVQIFVNGAGGEGHYSLGSGSVGTAPDVFGDDSNFGFLRVELADRDTAVFQNFSTGPLGTEPASPIGPSVTIRLDA